MPNNPPLPVLETRFTTKQLVSVLEQSIILSCACPAQVCRAINAQRSRFDYQLRCLDSKDTDAAVHRRIADATRATHAELETCLHDILVLEGWDMQTLVMPAELTKRLAQEIELTG